MLYDRYRNKMKKVAAFLSKVYVRRVPILLSLMAFALVVTVMVMTKGLIVAEKNCPAEVVYGEKLGYRAYAVLGRVTYEYREQGSEAWTTEKPEFPGDYQVRAMCKSSSGEPRYGDVHDFTILHREITLSVADSSVTYGERPKLDADIAKGDTLSCDIVYEDISASETLVWIQARSISITDEKGNSRMDGYIILDTPKTAITILPRTLKVTVSDASKVFDDTKLTYDGYEISGGSLAEGDSLLAVFDAYIVEAGTKVNTPRLRVYTAGGIEVTQQYDMQISAGQLTVEQKPLILKAGSVSYVYTGYAQEWTEFTVDSSTPLVSGHTIEALGGTSLTDCGTVDNVVRVRIRNAKGYDRTDSYSIFVEAGTLTVTPRVVTVHSHSETLVYNGQYQSVQEVTVENGVGDSVRAVDYATIRDVGSTENRLSVAFYRDSQDITANYIISYTYGTITVTERPITVVMGSTTREYDDTPLTDKTFSVSRSPYGLASGHTMTLQTEGSITGVGITTNRYVEGTAVIRDRDGTDVSSNYVMTFENGTLCVKPRAITITTPDATKVYDGQPLQAKSFTVTKGTLVAGHVLSVYIVGTRTLAGSSLNACNQWRTTVTVGDRNVTENYEITYDEGILKVTRRPITVSTQGDEWMYDGEVHYGNPKVTLDPETPLVKEHILKQDPTGSVSVINAGTVENVQTVHILYEGADVTDNYEITYDYGELTVRPRPIVVCTESTVRTYDGTAVSGTACRLSDVSPYPLVAGHEMTTHTYTTVTDAGVYENVCTVSLCLYTGSTALQLMLDVTANYDITYENGTITILPRPIGFRLDGTKVYDGTPLVEVEVTLMDGYTPIEGHTIRALPVESINEAGSVECHVDLTAWGIYDARGGDVTANYTLAETEAGVLTVIPRPISVRSANGVKVYDGDPLTAPYGELTEDSLPLVKAHSLSLYVSGSATEIGLHPNTCDPDSLRILDAEGRDVTRNYTVESLTEGTLTVMYDATVTVTTGSAVKYYDGLPLFCDEFTTEVSRGTLPEGHIIHVDVTGQITEAGSADNTAVVTLRDGEGNDITPLVELVLKPGVLTVLKGDDDGEMTVGRVCADTSGRLYLRLASYGDYTGRGWNPAIAYTGTLSGGYSCNYLPSVLLKNLGVDRHTLQFADMRMFMIPYYMEVGGSAPVVGSDTVYSSLSVTEYTATYYPFEEGLEWLSVYYGLPDFYRYLLMGSCYTQEVAYRAFVHSQYLTVDDETAAYMQGIIAAEGFDASDPNVIADVAAYIQAAALYDANYPAALDDSANVAVAFLRDYKAGVCTHFATAATLLYRTLGIPARYTTGFTVDTVAGEWVEIKSPGHAWVEVYVDGLGWVQVEVTGSGSGDSAGTDTPTVPTEKTALELIPAFRHKVYDGTYLYAADELVMTPSLVALLEQGYTYSVRVSGAQREIGTGESTIAAFTLYDPDGTDVTDRYRLVKSSGLLRVTGETVEVLLHQLQKSYDGTPLTYGIGDYEIIHLPEGVTVELTVLVSLIDVGYLTLADINRDVSRYADYHVLRDGVDVTDSYPLVFTLPEGTEDYPPVCIRPRTVELTAASETRMENGEPLENARVYLSKGTLAAGHTLEASAEGVCTAVGTVENTVGTVIIRDAEGRDVTHNYTVVRVSGRLTLLADG